MRGSKAIVGVFKYLDDAVRAVEYAKREERDYRVFSPFWTHQIEEVSLPGKSNVRKVTLTGALTGLVFGFTLAFSTAMDYPLRVSAKDIVAPPAVVVIGYECTILFGALFTLLAVLHFCRLPDLLRKIGYDPRFSDNRFGVVVGGEANEVDRIKKGLLDSGAEEVSVREGL